MPSATRAVSIGVALGFLSACGAAPRSEAASDGDRQPVIYGEDGRTEYFSLTSESLRSRIARSVVALIPNARLAATMDRLGNDVPSLGTGVNLCDGEPFTAQPAAAFCSGVVVDRGLVLTAGHCLRILGLAEFSVVFGYFYRDADTVGLALDAVVPTEIVAETLDPSGSQPRLDYGWIRIAGGPQTDAGPAVYRSQPPISLMTVVTTVGAANGVPLKTDEGGRVRDPRDGSDYFLVTSDTTEGWSGGPAFDADLVLTGVLARGAPDFVTTDDGCVRNVKRSESESATEEYTYVHQAIRGLCDVAPDATTICRPNCEEPCSASAVANSWGSSDGGCKFGGARPRQPLGSLLLLLAIVGIRRRAGRTALDT